MAKVEFDPTQSHLIGFAINYQSHGSFEAKSLSQTVVHDAKLISETFVQIGTIPMCNAAVLHCDKTSENCTFKGMKSSFVKAVKSVGEDGLLVFHLSGHGFTVRDDQWGLAPSDFDYTESTYVTARVLNDWLDCKAKHVLFTLDCCYAGGLADALGFTDIAHRSSFVLCAGTAMEASYSIDELGNSTPFLRTSSHTP